MRIGTRIQTDAPDDDTLFIPKFLFDTFTDFLITVCKCKVRK